MKLFKLVKDEEMKHDDFNHIKIYESENYKLNILYWKKVNVSPVLTSVSTKNGSYIPSILIRINNDIEIQSSDWGALGCEEIEKIIKQYKIAIDSVQEIKEILINNKLV